MFSLASDKSDKTNTKKNQKMKEDMFTGFINENPNVKMRCTNLFDQVYYIINDPELIKEVTVEKPKLYTKQLEVLFVDLLVEEGILINSGEKWKN